MKGARRLSTRVKVSLVFALGLLVVTAPGYLENLRFVSDMNRVLEGRDIVFEQTWTDEGGYPGAMRKTYFAVVELPTEKDFEAKLRTRCKKPLEISISAPFEFQVLYYRGKEQPIQCVVVNISYLRSARWYDWGQWLA